MSATIVTGVRMALIQKQFNLFDPDVELSRLGASRRDLTAWWNSGFLTFDPDAVQRFERWMFEEVAFIAPIARTEFSVNAIHAMLESLPRPYAHRHAEISFDFQLGRWRRTYSAGEIVDAVAEDTSRTADAIRAGLRVLLWTKQREELENIRGLVDQLLGDDLW